MSTSIAGAAMKCLGWGSLGLGAWGLIDPKGLTGMMGDDPDLGRPLGVRDVAIGIALLRWPGPWPVALRTVSDLHDAVRLRTRSPNVALGAAAACLCGLMLLASQCRDDRRPVRGLTAR